MANIVNFTFDQEIETLKIMIKIITCKVLDPIGKKLVKHKLTFLFIFIFDMTLYIKIIFLYNLNNYFLPIKFTKKLNFFRFHLT